MTGSLINLPITSPVAGAAGSTAPGQGKAAGFDALLAAFFGASSDMPTEGGLFGEGRSAKEEGANAGAPEATLVANPDAMTLAAMMAAPQAPLQAAPITAAATAPPSAPPTTAAELAGTALAPGAAEAAVSAVATAEEGQASAAEDEAVPASAKGPDLTGNKLADDSPRSPPNANAAARASAPPLPQAQPIPIPVQPTSQSLAAAEAVLVEEPVPEKPAQAGKAADAARKNGHHVAGSATGAVAEPDAPTAVVAAADAASLGDNGSAADQAGVAKPLIREARAEPAKADAADPADGQAPIPAAPTHASAQAQAHASIHSAVRGSPETVANLAAQIIQKLDGRSTRFDVELNPIGLGQVSVAVEIAANGKMTAAMSFETQHAANELRGRSADLQRALEQAGFDVSGGLSFDVAGDGRSAWADQQQQQQQANGAWRGRAFQAVLGTAGDAAESAVSDALNLQRRTRSGVDVRI